MNKFFNNTLLVCLLTGMFFTTQAQTDNATASHEVSIKIPEVAILDVEPANNSFSLAPTEPDEAGFALDFSKAINADLWLNYSSIVGSTSDKSRTIDVKVGEGSIPDGLLLKVTAGADNGTGDGVMGKPNPSAITLSNTAQEIITGIGSCYTGSPEKNGHQLTYALELNEAEGSYGKIDFDQSTTIKIVYTISE